MQSQAELGFIENFDLLVVPGANHPAGRGNDPTAPYGDHKRFDFFVQRLLGVTPPPWNAPARCRLTTFRSGSGSRVPRDGLPD